MVMCTASPSIRMRYTRPRSTMLTPSSGSMTSRSASRTPSSVISSGSLGPVLQRDRPGKQDVVLEMNVPVQVLLEALKFGHADAICRTSIVGRGVATRQRANRLELVGRVAMFALHHPNRVFDGAERTQGPPVRIS